MRTIFTFLLAVTTFLSAIAYDYSYRFSDTPVSEALLRISKEHPDITVSFIYRELDNYRTSARIDTDNPYDALRETIGTNPISIVKKNGRYYIEALQHGKYRYTGRIIGTDRQPVAAATVMLLAPKDSTVITYGIADDEGRFSIPCDRQDVIGKISSIGYRTLYQRFSKFKVGILTMEEYARTLGEVKVEADYARLYADKSVYIPTSRQKNASQTATDLLQRMAIPQLSPGNVFETPSRQPVKIYIDYIEATEQELSGIQMADVKRVEYYDYPSDSRFQGNAHVINFIMQQYEYG